MVATARSIWRSTVKLLHWTAFGALIATLVAGNSLPLRVAFSLAVGLWASGTLLFGLSGRPGPALTGALRRLFVPAHALLLALLGLAAAALWSAEPGPLSGSVRTLFLVTLGAGLLHGIFHMWRHTVLNDGALRNMTPRIIHDFL